MSGEARELEEHRPSNSDLRTGQLEEVRPSSVQEHRKAALSTDIALRAGDTRSTLAGGDRVAKRPHPSVYYFAFISSTVASERSTAL